MATETQRSRSRERLEALAGSGLDTVALQMTAVGELKRVIGFDRWCWPSADPETLLPGAGIADHDYGPRLPRALELEYSGADFAAKDVLATSPRRATSLRRETNGDLVRSPRWEEVMAPVGIGDVAATACSDRFGCWGWVEVYRDHSDRAFDELDLELMAQVGPALGSALRRRSTIQPPTGPGATSPPGGATDAVGVLLLDAQLRPVGRTESATQWLAGLPAAEVFEAWGMLPAAVYPAAALARRGSLDRAHVLLPMVSGGWVRVDAAPLQDGAGVVVTLRSPTEAQLFTLLGRVHGLSPRESEAARLLVLGEDTRASARQMGITPNTLHDHLKSAMRKVGAHSRAELVAMLTGSSEAEVHLDVRTLNPDQRVTTVALASDAGPNPALW